MTHREHADHSPGGRIKLLMTMVEVGSGHKTPAVAVAEAIRHDFPDMYQIDIVDFAAQVGAKTQDEQIKESWDIALRFPFVARLMYALSRVFHPVSQVFTRLFLREFIKRAIRFIADYKPDIVFSTYTFCTTAAVVARNSLGLKFPIIVYVVDPFDGYNLWAERRADYFLVASEESKDRLISFGIDETKIWILDFPVSRKFQQITRSREEIAQDYPLKPNRPTLLITSGGFGVGKVSKYGVEIYRRGLPVNLLFVCGRNEDLRRELIQLVEDESSDTVLVPLGYVTNMNELQYLADMVVGKAGASTAFESLIMGNPVLFTEWVAQNDKHIVDHFCRNEYGWYAKTKREFFEILERILESDELERYTEYVRRRDFNTGVSDVSLFIDTIAKSGDPD